MPQGRVCCSPLCPCCELSFHSRISTSTDEQREQEPEANQHRPPASAQPPPRGSREPGQRGGGSQRNGRRPGGSISGANQRCVGGPLVVLLLKGLSGATTKQSLEVEGKLWHNRRTCGSRVHRRRPPFGAMQWLHNQINSLVHLRARRTTF